MKKILANHYIIAFMSTLIISVGMLVTSFFLPPKGEINPSVLRATAQLFMWPTLAFGTKAIGEFRRCKELEEKNGDEK